MTLRSLPPFMFAVTLFTLGGYSQGCSSAVYVTFDGAGDSLSYREFNKEVSREKLRVHTSTGYTRSARDFRVAPDSCVWIDAEAALAMHAQISEMKQVSRTDHFRGFWNGVLYGGLGSLGVGYVVVLSTVTGHTGDDAMTRAFLPPALGAAGLMFGGLIGILAGYECDYVMRPFSGGATVIYLHDKSRIIGTLEELDPERSVVMRTWNGDRVVIDHAVIERIDVYKE